MPGDPTPASAGPAEPESAPSTSPGPQLGFDRQGLLEIIAGAVVALIALFTSYDHITIAGSSLPLQQQWGIGFIAASLALVVVDAQLATRSRLREADECARERDRTDQERSRAAQERIRADQARKRADQARNRAAEAAECQG
jgi:hypothetical protein